MNRKRAANPGMVFGAIRQARLSWRLLKDPRVPTLLKVLLPVLAVVYTVSPLDFVPDFLPVLGQLDDVSLLIAALALFTRLAPSAVVAEHLQAMMGHRAASDKPASWQEPVIDADYQVNQESRRSATGRS
jgi:uncharacterized membrane protein YkvA (DUF1232 family)